MVGPMQLFEYLLDRGESENAFARRSGIAQSTVNRFILGQALPSLLNARKIVQTTGGLVQYDDLLDYYESLEDEEPEQQGAA